MLDNFGESKVTVKKDELLNTLKKNRDNHKKIFLEAQQEYRKDVIVELDRMLKDAREGKQIVRAVELIEPVEHTTDYNRVIKMLEMSVASEVSISESQFREYVMDDWGWNQQFVASTANYLNKRR